MNVDKIDLEQIEASAQATKKVGVAFNEDGEPTVGFIIVGKDSKQYREKAAQLRAKVIRRQANTKEKIDRKTEEGALKLDSIVQSNQHEEAVAVVVGWFGFESGGKPAEFSAELVDKVLKAKPTWREAITLALEDTTGFLMS